MLREHELRETIRRDAVLERAAQALEGTNGQPDATSLSRNGGILIAIITGVVSIIGSGMVLIGTLATDDDPNPVSDDCAVVLDHYKDLAQGDRAVADVLTKRRTVGGKEAKSIVESDTAAVKCSVTREVIIDLSLIPK
jgi:hypothetical protein